MNCSLPILAARSTASRPPTRLNQARRCLNSVRSMPCLVAPDPRPGGHVGNGVVPGGTIPGQEIPAGQLGVHDVVQADHLVGVAFNGVVNLVRLVVAEMGRLPGHGAQARHLPEQPLFHVAAPPLIGGIKPPRLVAQILQNGPRFKDRNSPAPRPVGIHEGGHAPVRREGQKARIELRLFRQINPVDIVGQAAFFQHDGNFPAVGRGPKMQFHGRHVAVSSFALCRAQTGSFRAVCRGCSRIEVRDLKPIPSVFHSHNDNSFIAGMIAGDMAQPKYYGPISCLEFQCCSGIFCRIQILD